MPTLVGRLSRSSTARCLDGSASSGTCSYASTELIEEGHQSVSRDPTQATDPDRLNRAGTDQRIHYGSSDAEPIGGFFHGEDERQSELIKLRGLPGRTSSHAVAVRRRAWSAQLESEITHADVAEWLALVGVREVSGQVGGPPCQEPTRDPETDGGSDDGCCADDSR
jgi:hypothetical protein